MPLCAVDGMAVTTVEGIGSTKTALHPVQVLSDVCHLFTKRKQEIVKQWGSHD